MATCITLLGKLSVSPKGSGYDHHITHVFHASFRTQYLFTLRVHLSSTLQTLINVEGKIMQHVQFSSSRVSKYSAFTKTTKTDRGIHNCIYYRNLELFGYMLPVHLSHYPLRCEFWYFIPHKTNSHSSY